MSAAESGRVLRPQGDIDADRVPALFREFPDSGPVAAIDLSAVGNIDSAGVALVRLWQKRSARHGVVTELRGAPAHYHQLCQAHRVGDEGNTP